MQLTI